MGFSILFKREDLGSDLLRIWSNKKKSTEKQIAEPNFIEIRPIEPEIKMYYLVQEGATKNQRDNCTLSSMNPNQIGQTELKKKNLLSMFENDCNWSLHLEKHIFKFK